VSTLEARLRDAYNAAAETIRPETVLPGGVGHLPDRTRHSARLTHRFGASIRLLPVTAAVIAVTVVAVAAAVLGSHAASGPNRPPATSSTTARAGAFLVALNWNVRPSMLVVNTGTGTAVAPVRLPFAAADLRAVATGNGRQFVVAAVRPGDCATSLYRFGLSGAGKPSTMTRLATVPGVIETPWSMAVAGNGRTVAYDSAVCGQRRHLRMGLVLKHLVHQAGYLTLVNTATGRAKRWSFETSTGIGGDVSLSADGQTVGMGDWVVRASESSGRLAQRGRVVARNGEFGSSVIFGGMEISRDGRAAYFSTFRVRHDKPAGGWQLRVLDLAAGRTRVVRSFPGTLASGGLGAFDPTGRYLLVEYIPNLARPQFRRLVRLDLGTGQVRQLHDSWAQDAAIAW
jgi:hypothetical protein